MKKLLIDGRTWTNTGIGVYLQSLVRYLDEHEQSLTLEILLSSKDYDDVSLRRFTKVRCDINLYSIKEQLWLGHVIKSRRPDLVHFPHFNVPIFYNRPFVFTFHDLITLRHYSKRRGPWRWLRSTIKMRLQIPVMRHGVKQAQAIITPTNAVKDDIVETLQARPDKIYPIHEGSGMARPAGQLPAEVKSSFVFFVGLLSAHKNVQKLIESWPQVEAKVPDVQLIIAGKGTDRALLERLAATISPNIKFLGYVTDPELGALYKHASGFVFPTLAEGFGLPPLEAMASGTPVAASDIPVLREVLDDSCLYFDPSSASSISEALVQLFTDDSLRAQLKARGFEQVKKFSWDKMGAETSAIYHRLLGSSESAD